MLASIALMPTPAHACSRAGAGFTHAKRVIPIDGALVFGWRCEKTCTSEDVPASLEVFARNLEDPELLAEVPIAGTVVRRGVSDSGGFGVWRPSQPLTAGQSYLAKASGQAMQGIEFSAVASLEFEPRQLSVQATVTKHELSTGDLICCESSRKDSCRFGAPLCFSLQRREMAGLTLVFQGLPTEESQWLYRTTYQADDLPPTVVESRPVPSTEHGFLEVAERYCYLVEAESVVSGERFVVAEGCVRPDFTSLDTWSISRDERAESLITCLEPPEGFADEWRAARQALNQDGGADRQVEETSPVLAEDDPIDNTVIEDGPGGCRVHSGRANLSALLTSLLLLGLARRKRTSA